MDQKVYTNRTPRNEAMKRLLLFVVTGARNCDLLVNFKPIWTFIRTYINQNLPAPKYPVGAQEYDYDMSI
jgi:hypothetical protein